MKKMYYLEDVIIIVKSFYDVEIYVVCSDLVLVTSA